MDSNLEASGSSTSGAKRFPQLSSGDFSASLVKFQDAFVRKKERENLAERHSLQLSSDRELREIKESGLCKACSTIGLDCEYPSTHHTPLNLQLSADRCSMCNYIYKQVSGTNLIDSTRSAEVTVDLINSTFRYRVPGSQIVFEMLNKTGVPFVQAGSIRFRSVPPDCMSDNALQLVRTWLDNCHSAHESCRRIPDFSLPTRILDVSGPVVCIREMKQVNTAYVALSHCWGNKPALTSLKSTLPDHMKEISMPDMPRTFQDAVTVTKTLGISYLWIDSLCIIQDSMEDWIAECPKMKAYYRNSYVTISALESPDSQHGFLAPRDTGNEVQLPNLTEAWIRPSFLDRGKIFQRAHLNHRGWALQERLLSTCVLHFTQREMFWECQTCSARESSVVENRGSTNFQLLVSSEGEDFKRALLSVGPDRFSQQDGAFALWMRLVRQFSRRSLTFSSDRLPAISGLAAMLASKTKSKYIAGIWEDDLHGLVWFKDGPYEIVSHATTRNEEVGYLAPSWSWVKMNESITYRFNEEEVVTSGKDPILISTDILTRDSDPFGCLSKCSITIQALTKPVQCVQGGSERASTHSNLVFGYVIPEHYEPSCFEALPIDIFAEDGTAVGTGAFDEEIEEKTLHVCKAVRIAERLYERQYVVYFILVQPDEDNVGAWRRVGAGVARDVAWRLHYSDFFDLWDWEELRLT